MLYSCQREIKSRCSGSLMIVAGCLCILFLFGGFGYRDFKIGGSSGFIDRRFLGFGLLERRFLGLLGLSKPPSTFSGKRFYHQFADCVVLSSDHSQTYQKNPELKARILGYHNPGCDSPLAFRGLTQTRYQLGIGFCGASKPGATQIMTGCGDFLPPLRSENGLFTGLAGICF